jgi:hypothetical protein
MSELNDAALKEADRIIAKFPEWKLDRDCLALAFMSGACWAGENITGRLSALDLIVKEPGGTA